MPTNRGKTSLRRRRRTTDPMREFDRLPADLRMWLANALLPWGPVSARRAFNRAVQRTRDRQSAFDELDRLERSLVARDARVIWGGDYPANMVQGTGAAKAVACQ